MLTKRQKLKKALRAVCAALFLTVNVVATTLALTIPQDDCAMACCLRDGYCCCKIILASAREADPSQRPDEISKVGFARPCPEGCANPAPASNLLARAQVRALHPSLTQAKTRFVGSRSSLKKQHTGASEPFSPRAPPLPVFANQ